jgi:tetratricopeptide (TPR) repeat protein
MRGVLLSLMVVGGTLGFCVFMYGLVTRDYQYLQLIKLGDKLMEERLPYQAAGAYGSAIGLRPEHALAYLKRAEAHRAQGDLASALKDLQRAGELSADKLTIHLRLADVHQAREEFDQAIHHYTQALQIDPESPAVLYKLGLASYRSGREREALAALERALALRSGFAEAHYLKAAVHRSLEEFVQAEAELQSALAAAPDLQQARWALIELYVDGAKADKAINLLEAEAARRPTDPVPFLRLADVYRKRGEAGLAIEAVGQALGRDPNLPEGYLRLGELWLQEGITRNDRVALEKAIAALESVAKMDPTNGKAALALGRAQLALGNDERAYPELQRASEATPMEPEAHRLLGDMYYAQGKLSEAITAYHVYRKLAGDTPALLERLGDAYLKLENPLEAAASYKEQAALERGNVTPLLKAARAYLAAGAHAQAAEACRAGLRLDPGHLELKKLLSRSEKGPARITRILQ